MEKAKQARTENEVGGELDSIKLAVVSAMSKGTYGMVEADKLKIELKGIIDDSELENISGEAPWTITTKLNNSYDIYANGNVEKTIAPTDIYVTLDGTTLRFYSQKENVTGTLYTKDGEPYNLKGVDFTSAEANPWYTNRANIKNVSIEEDIVPTSTCRWFNECAITGVDHIERLNTRYVTKMDRMFRNCSNLESLDVSKFDTRNVTDMSVMFQDCSKLTVLNVSKFKTGKVENMKWMFNGCSGLTELDVSKWDTSSATDIGTMFQNCSGLKGLDLSNWDIAKVTNISYMFSGCSNLTTIYVGNGWNTDAVTQSDYMFYQCYNLKGGQGTTFNDSYIDKTRAKIDGGLSDPGYFVDKKIGIVPLVGDYIEYDVAYSDVSRNTNYSSTTGWKIMDVGERQANGKYEGIKIIPTGIPAKLRYQHNNANGNTWWDTTQTGGTAYQAAAGLSSESLFENILFDGDGSDTENGWNKGRYRAITNNDQGVGYNSNTGTVFLTTKAKGVHNLTLNDINITLNKVNRKSIGDDGYRNPDNCTDIINSNYIFNQITAHYWISKEYNDKYLWTFRTNDGQFLGGYGGIELDLLPVISLKSVTLTKCDTYWKVN